MTKFKIPGDESGFLCFYAESGILHRMTGFGLGSRIGVDGCRAGWLAVDIEQPDQPRVFQDIRALWDACRHANRVLIDIPIGLTREYRPCDVAAKRILGKWNSRVFLTPPREVLAAPDYPAANRLCRESRGSGLSKQTWAICPKIREVDELMRSDADARRVIRECHPEMCFWGLAGKVVEKNKSTADGLARRLSILGQAVAEANRLVADALLRVHAEAKPDDIVDALAAAWCAAGNDGEIRTLPASPSKDDAGLPVEMVYRVARF